MKLHGFLFLIFISFCISPSAWSAKVTKVKGSSVLIDVESSKLRTGGLYYLVLGGKKKAIIKVVKQKPGKAIGKVLKGKARPGFKLVRRKSKKKGQSVARSKKKLPPLKDTSSKTSSSKKSSSSSNSGSLKSKLGIGGVIGFAQNSHKVSGNLNSSGSGSSTNFELIADYQFSDKISFRASAGQQTFSSEDGLAVIDLSYINIDGWARYHFNQFWAGAGASILLSPGYGETTAVEESELGSQFFLQVGGGMDYQISDKLYIPIWAEYGTTVASGDATLSAITLKAGIALRL